MAESAREFFESLEGRVDASKLSGVNNSYLFEIDGAGTWKVDIADGQVNVTEGGGDADATFATSEETFKKIVGGEQNAMTAVMTGKVKIRGDMGAATKLQKLF